MSAIRLIHNVSITIKGRNTCNHAYFPCPLFEMVFKEDMKSSSWGFLEKKHSCKTCYFHTLLYNFPISFPPITKQIGNAHQDFLRKRNMYDIKIQNNKTAQLNYKKECRFKYKKQTKTYLPLQSINKAIPESLV